jgi:hypothetical protein
MEVAKKETKTFETSFGPAHVWGLTNSLTKEDAGWHFMLPGEDGTEHYLSNDGALFFVASFDSVTIMPDAEETDTEKVELLRELWAKYIEETWVSPGP